MQSHRKWLRAIFKLLNERVKVFSLIRAGCVWLQSGSAVVMLWLLL